LVEKLWGEINHSHSIMKHIVGGMDATKAFMCFRCTFGVILWHFKVDKMKWGVIFTKKKKNLFTQIGNTHSGKPQKSLEKPGFQGIPRKFSSLKKTFMTILVIILTSRKGGVISMLLISSGNRNA
jgi:hypothetical protein